MDGTSFAPFPHHKLHAYHVALEFVHLVHQTPIQDAEMRKHARQSAGSSARNIAEGSGRTSRADKRRCYGIARGELCEAVAAVEIDHALGGCSAEQLRAIHLAGSRLNAMLTPLVR